MLCQNNKTGTDPNPTIISCVRDFDNINNMLCKNDQAYKRFSLWS